jgi:hypothetical protein
MGVVSRQIDPKRLETKLEKTNKPISSTARLSQLISFPFFILTGRDQIIQIDECRILAEKTLRGLFRSTGGGTQRRRRQRIPQQVQLEGIVRVVVGAVRCRRFRRVPVPVRYHVELVQVRRRALAGRRPRVVPGPGDGAAVSATTRFPALPMDPASAWNGPAATGRPAPPAYCWVGARRASSIAMVRIATNKSIVINCGSRRQMSRVRSYFGLRNRSNSKFSTLTSTNWEFCRLILRVNSTDREVG